MAYTQAAVKTDIFMTLPKGTTLNNVDPNKHVLQLKQNLYGLKDGQLTWHEHIKKGLLAQGFQQSKIDPCLFIKPQILLVLYIDDAALLSPSAEALNNEIAQLHKSFQLTDKGELKDYLGVRFIKQQNGIIKLCQPKIIDRCLKSVSLNADDVKTHDTPAESTTILHADKHGEKRKSEWNYRAAIGCFNYVQAMTRPDLSYATHQCTRFCMDPKLSHEKAVKQICCYLRGTRDMGLRFKPDLSQGFQCYVDADWAGNWNKQRPDDPSTLHSRTGYIIMYAGCPILWASKIQPLIALLTTEAEIIALSSALREVIHLMELLNELRSFKIPIPFCKPKIKCQVFEDNAACIEVSKEPKLRPRTKHLAVRLFHFRQYVERGDITIQHISSKEQLADIFTKPLPRDQFRNLRNKIMNWLPSTSASQREGV
ncbi:hypothetical protein ACA910_009292 [Epithemia clementina (nom. ined.)]